MTVKHWAWTQKEINCSPTVTVCKCSNDALLGCVVSLPFFVYQQSACLTVTKRLISNHGQSVGVLLWLSWGSVFKVPRLVLCDHRPRMSGVDTYLLGLSVLPKSKTPSSPVVLWHDCFQMMPWNGHHWLVQGETEWIFIGGQFLSQVWKARCVR